MMSKIIRNWLKQGNLKPKDIKITEKGAVYNLKYFKKDKQ